MHQPPRTVERVVSLDVHPDTFTAAILTGPTPASAIVERMFDKVPLGRLEAWAKKNTNPGDTCVLEASGNSFHVARMLQGLGLKALVLESTHLGKLKEVHANNDRISAVRIGKAYLAGTAKHVWIPDLKTQQRRDWMHAHRKTVKRTTQTVNRLDSYLSDNGVRLDVSLARLSPQETTETIREAHPWTPAQWRVLEIYMQELAGARAARSQWESHIAAEVATDPMMLSIVRLCGVRDVVAFATGAIIGDIARFPNPKKLVRYVGLNPAFCDSGEGEWSGGVGGHGRKDLRSLLIESAHSVLASTTSPLAAWGRKLLARKGSVNLVVAAVARRLLVTIWYLLSGKTEPLKEVTPALKAKLGKIVSKVGEKGLQGMGLTRKSLIQQMVDSIATVRVYDLGPARKFEPGATKEPGSGPPLEPSTA